MVPHGRNVWQRRNLGPWKRPSHGFAAVSVLAAAAALAGGPATWTPAARAAEVAENVGQQGPSPEALLARGIAHFAASDMLLGLEELRAAARARPEDPLARKSLATALLRAGHFPEADAEFSAALGEGTAGGLSNGRIAADGLPADIDADIVLGLATARQMLGRTREAERLYRAYAALVGPTSARAGRAYYRLFELATESQAVWLDAEAELAKARAVDPDIGSARLLPAFVDPEGVPTLEPYLRPIELVESRTDSGAAYDTIPVLDLWTPPADSSGAATLAPGGPKLIILVGADGVPEDVEVEGDVSVEVLDAIRSAVAQWRFKPATSGGEPVPAWIRYGRDAGRGSGGETAAD